MIEHTAVPVQQLDIQSLKPFPLPNTLSKLPTHFLQTLADLYELTQGYIKSLDKYQEKETELRQLVSNTTALINSIIGSIDQYDSYGETIRSQISELDTLFKEFSVLETTQYQLLSTNYNQNLLQAKFKKLLQEENERAAVIVSEYRQEPRNMGEFLSKFRESRKTYHMRREKLNRWEEDRVSGFI